MTTPLDDFFIPVSESKSAAKPLDDFFTPLPEPSRTRSIAGAFPKGAIKKAADIAELFQRVPLPKGEFNPPKVREFAEKKFPTLEREPEKLLERAGGITTEAFLSPGGLAAKGIQIPLATGLGYLAEKMGAPGWGQAIAESLPFFFSGGKKIPLKSSQKKLGEFLRNQGLTENEIAPLLKTPEQINRWSTFASKGKKSRKLMESLYNKTGHIYDSVISESKSLPPLSEQAKETILSNFIKIKEDIPNIHWELIEKDVKDFLTKGRAGAEDLINLDKDINAILGVERGAWDAVGRLKTPIKEALESISPKIADDYSLAKEFYKSRSRIKGALINPKDFDRFLDIGEAYGLAQGIFNRDFGMISKVIGAAGGRKIAREMLINPRLQNNAIRMGEALKKNKLILVSKYLKEFNQELSKDDPELANQIDELFPK